MKIVVCVKQVPNTMEVKIDPKTGTLIRDKAPAILNTFDEFAIEESVQIREKLGGEVVALTMGPPNAKEVLLDAYALGADLGVHVNDRAVRRYPCGGCEEDPGCGPCHLRQAGH